MIWFPKARIWPGYVIDHDELMEEFYAVLRVAQRTTQYQWINQAFTDRSKLQAGEHVQFHVKSKSDTLDVTGPASSPDLTNSGAWDLPYNTTPTEVGSGDVGIDWVSTYPELIWFAFSFQYIRESHAAGDPLEDFFVRSRIQIALDEVRIPGAGCYAIPINPTPRGLGLSQRAIRATIIVVQSVPPGAHRISPVASQYNASISGSENDPYRNKDGGIVSGGPDSNVVVIANRKSILLRFMQGMWLGS